MPERENTKGGQLLRKNGVKILIEWLESGKNSAPELRATLCRLTIEIAGKRVSHFVDHRTEPANVSEEIIMPAYPLAEGFTTHWWYLMAGRSGALRLRKFREGFAVPDVRFNPDGRSVEVIVEPLKYNNPPVVFSEWSRESVDVATFANDIQEFVANVHTRLVKAGIHDSLLTRRWTAIQTSLADHDELLFCKAAGALGIDPYACEEIEAEVIARAGERFSGDALGEFLASQSPLDVSEAITWLDKQEHSLASVTALPALADWAPAVRKRLVPDPWSGTAWGQGYAAAEASRSVLNLHSTTRFKTIADLSTICGNDYFRAAADQTKWLRADVAFDGKVPKIVVAGFTREAPSIFALARAIGDFVVFGEEGRSPIMDTFSYRQKVGRAYAAEFLAPAEVVIPMFKAGRTIEDIGADRGVSDYVIERQIENHQHLL